MIKIEFSEEQIKNLREFLKRVETKGIIEAIALVDIFSLVNSNNNMDQNVINKSPRRKNKKS